MNFQVGVKIILKNDKGRYLLIKRSSEKYPEVGAQWDIVGGRIEAGISLLENLSREVREETSLEIIGTPILIAAQDILKPDMHVVRLTYVGTATGDVILSDEHTDYIWASLDEISKLESIDSYFKSILGLIKS